MGMCAKQDTHDHLSNISNMLHRYRSLLGVRTSDNFSVQITENTIDRNR